MAAYLDAYARAHRLDEVIRFGVTVERLDPEPGRGWSVGLDDGSLRRYDAIVVAVGLFWSPKVPTYPGTFRGNEVHSHDYRTPESFAGQRILVVGSGQSAAEIAVEVSGVTARTFLSVRRGTHVLPRWIGRRPYDALDVNPLNRMPWRLINLIFRRRVRGELGPLPPSWPRARHRLLEEIPIVSSDLLPSVRRRDVVVKPAIDRLAGDLVRFADGSEEPVERMVYATGYRITLPFLSPSLISANGRDFPLYRRIVPPGVPRLLFAGFVDAPGGLLPIVEAQGEWIAAVLSGRLRLPGRDQMRHETGRAERRTRKRFPSEGPLSVRCDPHGYRRVLQADLPSARATGRVRGSTPTRRGLTRVGATGSAGEPRA